MGQFLDTLNQGKNHSKKEQMISMEDYVVNASVEHGGIVMRSKDG